MWFKQKKQISFNLTLIHIQNSHQKSLMQTNNNINNNNQKRKIKRILRCVTNNYYHYNMKKICRKKRILGRNFQHRKKTKPIYDGKQEIHQTHHYNKPRIRVCINDSSSNLYVSKSRMMMM